ncbi:MAG: HlyC/CorC family transporter [Leptolyngbyaceae cyanobacterium CSU_1_3]|nr:HlyC/CorC family transporter [Leptolyngbyaceae cyanobacterium CSU_1_3]
MIAPFAVVLAAVLQNSGSTDVPLRFLSVLMLIMINAFFVTAEFSIVSVRRSRINQLVDAGDLQARTVQDLQRGIDRLLSTTQLGITLSSLALGWIGESTMAVLVSAWIVQLPIPIAVAQSVSHSASIPIAFFLIAYLQIVLGELCPKSVAMLYAEEIARFLGPFSLAIARFFNPFIWILNQSTRLLLRMVGVQYTGQGWYNQVTPEELQLIIATSSESSGLEAEERELLSNVFEFGAVPASEVMVRRSNMTALTVEATARDLLEEVAQSGHSHYPVTGDSLDDICGMVHFKELAEPLVQGTLNLESPIKPWIRPARFVPEYTPLGELLSLMQRSRQHLVIVVDEFGGTAGLVSLQDIVSQIIGDSPEPESEEERLIQVLDENTFVVQAQMNVEEVNEQLRVDLPVMDEYQTLGGFLFYQWQRIPNPGETLQYGNYELTVIASEGPRLHQIQVHRIEPSGVLNDPSVSGA